MGVTRRWLTWIVVGGLVLFFLGERAFHDVLAVRLPLSLLGVVAMVGSLALRVLAA